MRPNGQIKILDFGIAKRLGDRDRGTDHGWRGGWNFVVFAAGSSLWLLRPMRDLTCGAWARFSMKHSLANRW